jgi:hypothetical protein
MYGLGKMIPSLVLKNEAWLDEVYGKTINPL